MWVCRQETSSQRRSDGPPTRSCSPCYFKTNDRRRFPVLLTCGCSHGTDKHGGNAKRGDEESGGVTSQLGCGGAGSGQRPLVEVLEAEVSYTLVGGKKKSHEEQR